MNGKIIGTSLIAATALFASTQSTAAIKSYVCNACSVKDIQSLANDGPAGDIYIWDMVAKKVTHFSVVGKNGFFHASQSIITADQQAQINQVQALYNEFGTLNINVSANYVPPAQARVNVLTTNNVPIIISKTEVAPAFIAMASNSLPSAFDLVNTPANQTSAIKYWQNSNFWTSTGLDATGSLATFATYFTPTQALLPIPVNLTITINFPDGSHANYRWSLTNFDWEYKTGESTDAIGNPIPESPAQIASANGRQNYIYPYTPNGVASGTRQWQNINSLGIKVDALVVTEHNTWVISCVTAGGTTGCSTLYGQ